jgi:ankyrin repeat protein
MADAHDAVVKRLAKGRTDLVFDVLAAGTATTTAGPDGVPLIGWCAYYGDVSAIKHLLANGERLEALGENFDLNGAAFRGHWRLCEFLIENGADANGALPETAETPLHAALSKANSLAHERVVEVLLRAGANPNAAAKHGSDTGTFMRDARTKGETPLHRAAAFATEGAIDMLIEKGARLDVRDSNGDTPLSWASWHLRPASILRKLCFGAHALHPDANWTGDHGCGPSGMEAHVLGTPHRGGK